MEVRTEEISLRSGVSLKINKTEDRRMCVGLSAKVVSVKDGTAVIDASGAKRDVSAELLEDLEPGDYVMVHAGVAIAKITADDNTETEGVMAGLTAHAR